MPALLVVVVVRVVVLFVFVTEGARPAEPPQVAVRTGMRVDMDELAMSVQCPGALAADG
jgi:hypothetical protein